MKTNYEELYREEMRKEPRYVYFWIGFFIAGLLFIVFFFLVVYPHPVTDKPEIQNAIVRDYILQYYPEYANCTIKYRSSFSCSSHTFTGCEGARVACYSNSDRDNSEIEDDNPKVIYITFKDDLTLDKLFEMKLKGGNEKQ